MTEGPLPGASIWSDIYFWGTALGASLVKVVTSPYGGVYRTLATVGCAVFAAIVFTDPLLVFFKLPASSYREAMAALVALTGEGIMRKLIDSGSKPEALLDIIKQWRAK